MGMLQILIAILLTVQIFVVERPVVKLILGVIVLADIVWFIVRWKRVSKEVDERMAEMLARRERLERDGITALATIRQIDMGGMTVTTGVSRELEVILGLDVAPENAAPFSTTMTTMISELHIPQYQPGKRLKIKYDPTDPTHSKPLELVRES
jgi:hypothetical protein